LEGAALLDYESFSDGNHRRLIDRQKKGNTAIVFAVFISLFFGTLIGSAAQPLISKLMINSDNRIIDEQPADMPILSSKSKRMASPAILVAKRLKQSVLNIDVKTKNNQSIPDDYQNQEKNQGVGSGVVVRSDGYIITNAHVIKDARKITATLADGTELKADIVGSDEETDIAVIKVNKRTLIPAPISKTGTTQVGSTVIAIGSPWELDQSVTSGIVSALHRKISVPTVNGEKFYPNLIQTDAAINPGSSGGALSDENGNLIGINTLIYSQSGGYEGVSFAIPIEQALETAKQIIDKGKVSHPYIGIIGQDVTEDIAKRYNLMNPKGVLLADVASNGSAAEAGLKKGDIVVGIEGTKIKNMDDVVASVQSHKIGEKIEVEFIRSKIKKQTLITIMKKPNGVK
jgi:S1-C subfamily serine protease